MRPCVRLPFRSIRSWSGAPSQPRQAGGQGDGSRRPAVVGKGAELSLARQQVHQADGEVAHHAGHQHAHQIDGQKAGVDPRLDRVDQLQQGGAEDGRQAHQEGEPDGKGAVIAPQHPRRDGDAGPGDAGQGAQRLGAAHQKGVQHSGSPLRFPPPSHPVGEKQDEAGGQQGERDKGHVGHGPLHKILDRQHHKQGQGSHNDEQHQPPGGGQLLPAPPSPGGQVPDAQEKFPDHVDDVLPVVDAHRDQGGKVQEHREKHLGLLHVFHGEEVLEQGQVARAGDGQEFRDPLQDPHQDRHPIGQNDVPP